MLMRYLIKQAKIVTPDKMSQRKDILIVNGIIKQIDRNIEDAEATVIKSKNLHVAIGFCDIGTFVGEPGLEERESAESISRAAAKGGYTVIAPFPNLQPVIDSKSTVRFVKECYLDSHLEVYPIGAISKGCQGQDIAEILDMHEHGAVAFSDGNKSIQNTGLLLRALQYSKKIKTPIIQFSDEQVLSKDTFMHEGATSTSLGLPGMPSDAETIMVKRDIDLAKYAESDICLHNISCKDSIASIEEANKKRKRIYSSVPAMNLIHIDEELHDFDTNLKVIPPLRSKKDRKALIKAVNTDKIDFISSNHQPIDLEHKDLEFLRSSFGASTLDTVFSSLLTYTLKDVSISKLVDKLAYGSRKVLSLSIPKIEVGEIADMVVFDPSSTWEVTTSSIFSKSKNNPYIGETLNGVVHAVFQKKQTVHLTKN